MKMGFTQLRLPCFLRGSWESDKEVLKDCIFLAENDLDCDVISLGTRLDWEAKLKRMKDEDIKRLPNPKKASVNG